MREQGEMELLAHVRKSRRQALRQRAQILMAYTPVYQIALICRTDEALVRKVMHAFIDFGQLTPPTTLGEPLTRWSLVWLKSYLERRRVVRCIAIETLRSRIRLLESRSRVA